MASNNYNPYNYQPYQQSSAPQYSSYQTAPAGNPMAQQPRQHYQQAPAATTQATDYMSYPAQSYNSTSYGGAQENGWSGNNYGGNRETTRGAAEVLRNMSNTTYTGSPSATATAAAPQSGFTATNSTSANSTRYSTSSSQHTQHTHAAQPSYVQSQARPRSVNANRAQAASSSRGLPSPATATGYSSQRTQNMYGQQQRPDSPAQNHYSHRTTTPVSTTRNAALTAASQYNDYGHRQLPSVDASRNTHNTAVSSSYSYAENPISTSLSAPSAQTAAPTNVSEQYNQTTATVDPMAVYDPWPEYQRQQEARRQQKAAEDAARAEEERQAEELRKEEERRKAEEEERARQAEAAAVAAQPKAKKAQISKRAQPQQSAAPEAAFAGPAGGVGEAAGDPANALEAEIRAMMSKMRELNSKDPALLARIWEEERRAKAPKSPTVQAKAAPQPAPATTAQAPTPKATTQKNKGASKGPPNVPSVAGPTAPTPVAATTPVTATMSVARPQAQAVAVSSPRPSGNTIWPPEKKVQLAHAASAYLNGQNPDNNIAPDSILSMLDGNPSYIELCEQLEGMSVKLDRAAFAKNLLTAVPDVNSASKTQNRTQPPSLQATFSAQPAPAPPPLAMRRDVATPVAATPQYASAAPSPMHRSPYPPFPKDSTSKASQIPVAEMVPIKAELKPPANKEEAARKRNFNDLIDLTLAVDEEDLEPLPKKQNVGSMYSYSPGPTMEDHMDIDAMAAPATNFHVPPQIAPQPASAMPPAPLTNVLRLQNIVQPLDKKKALRRNEYNIKTIARDVLLACGRHPEERSLNAHLDPLKFNLQGFVTNEADLSTLRWDLLDPGQPPRGYYRDGGQTLAEDADDEDDSEDERPNVPRPRSMSHVTATGVADARVQALPPTNPFKRRGRPPRHSYPDSASPATPSSSPPSRVMSSSAPRPSAGVGYAAFRSVSETLGPDGKPLPKKKGRPVGWRKAIHGSAAAQARPATNGHTGPVVNSRPFQPTQPSALRNVRTGEEPITISSRSPSASRMSTAYQSFKCKWENCSADLHNLETLKKHVQKLHNKQTAAGTFECLWSECGGEVTNVDPMTSMRIERNAPIAFSNEARWREHLELKHFKPLSWQLGDGPASGLSDANESDAYLSDARGRRVTPRITAAESVPEESPSIGPQPGPGLVSSPRRGRPPKNSTERIQIARQSQEQLIAQKKRVGGPGMDRGGATLANEKRRKGFSDDDQTEEEFVDAEE